MTQVIIFPHGDGVAVIHPAPECELPIEEVARKDVMPQGTPYKIIGVDDLPADRTFREAWEADFSEPDGYSDPEGWWAEYDAKLAVEEAAREAERNRTTEEEE